MFRQADQQEISPKQGLINALKATLDAIASDEKKHQISKNEFLEIIRNFLIDNGKVSDIKNDLDDSDQLCFHSLPLAILAKHINDVLGQYKDTMLARELSYHLEIYSSRHSPHSYHFDVINMLSITAEQSKHDVTPDIDSWEIENHRRNRAKLNSDDTSSTEDTADTENTLETLPHNQPLKIQIYADLKNEIKRLRNNYPGDDLVTEFCDHLDLLKNATIREGATDEMLLDDIERVSYALADFNINTARKLYKRIDMHQQSSQNRVKGGGATVTGGGLLGASTAYGLTLFSIPTPMSAIAGAFILTIGATAGICFAKDANNKRGTLADLESKLIAKKMHELLMNKQYATYLHIAIKFIMMDATKRSTNPTRDQELGLCSDIIQRDNKCDSLFLMINRLLNAYHTLKTDSAKSVAADEIYHLIHTISPQLRVENQHNEYTLIQVQLIKIDAQKRSSNPQRDRELDALIEHIENNLASTDNFYPLLHQTAETLSKVTWNKSDTANALINLAEHIKTAENSPSIYIGNTSIQ